MRRNNNNSVTALMTITSREKRQIQQINNVSEGDNTNVTTKITTGSIMKAMVTTTQQN